MSEWKEYKLGDIVDVAQGLAINAKTKHLLSDSGLPLLRITDLIHNTQVQFVKKDLAPKQTIALEEDIIYTRTGQVGLVFKGKIGIIHNNCFKVIPKNNKVTRNYIYWFLRQSVIKEIANSIASGSVQKDLNHSAFKSININVPEIGTQNSISEVLSSLEDKIELNNKINQELESLAQLLFKRWFVDFEFPNQNGEPYKSSGGEMFDSELGELPEGWSVSKFENLVKISTGKGINKRDYQDDGKYPIIGANGVMGYYSNYNIEGFKILTGRVGTLGTVRISKEKAWTSDNVLICEPLKIEYSHYGYFIMKGFDYNSLNRGSTQPLITQTDLKTQTIVLPQNGVLLIFQNQMDYLLNMIQLNNSETINLVKLRDSLLPKLISGELQINDN